MLPSLAAREMNGMPCLESGKLGAVEEGYTAIGRHPSQLCDAA